MNNIPRKEYYHFSLVLIACFVSVYFMPKIINQIFFLAILLLVYNSRKGLFLVCSVFCFDMYTRIFILWEHSG